MIAQLGCKWCILLWALPSGLWVGSQCSRSINFFIPWLFCVSVCCPNAALTQCWTESAVYSKVAINDISFLQNTAFLLLPTQQLQRSYVISFWNVPYISSERWTGKTHSPKGLSSHGTAAQGTVECPSLGALKRLWGSCGVAVVPTLVVRGEWSPLALQCHSMLSGVSCWRILWFHGTRHKIPAASLVLAVLLILHLPKTLPGLCCLVTQVSIFSAIVYFLW